MTNTLSPKAREFAEEIFADMPISDLDKFVLSGKCVFQIQAALDSEFNDALETTCMIVAKHHHLSAKELCDKIRSLKRGAKC